MRGIRRSLGVIAASALVCAALAACSLTTSLDGLTGGATPETPGSGADAAAHTDGGGRADAATSPDDAGSLSDGVDADVADAPSTDGDTADTAPGADAAPTTFCAGLAPRPLFCLDFDEGQPVASGWDHVASSNGTASIDTATVTSSPSAMKENVNALPTGTAVDVGAYRSFPSFAAKAVQMTYAFDLYIEKIDQTHTAPAVAAALVFFDAAGASWQVQLAITYSGSSISVRTPEWWVAAGGGPSGYTEHLTTAALPLQKWTRVSMQLTMPSAAGGAATLQLALNGTAVGTANLKVTTSNATPQVILGLSYVQTPTDAWIVRYDDVTLDAKSL